MWLHFAFEMNLAAECSHYAAWCARFALRLLQSQLGLGAAAEGVSTVSSTAEAQPTHHSLSESSEVAQNENRGGDKGEVHECVSHVNSFRKWSILVLLLVLFCVSYNFQRRHQCGHYNWYNDANDVDGVAK